MVSILIHLSLFWILSFAQVWSRPYWSNPVAIKQPFCLDLCWHLKVLSTLAFATFFNVYLNAHPFHYSCRVKAVLFLYSFPGTLSFDRSFCCRFLWFLHLCSFVLGLVSSRLTVYASQLRTSTWHLKFCMPQRTWSSPLKHFWLEEKKSYWTASVYQALHQMVNVTSYQFPKLASGILSCLLCSSRTTADGGSLPTDTMQWVTAHQSFIQPVSGNTCFFWLSY